MPRYNYICNDCRIEAESIKGSPLTDEELLDEIIFETSHAMNPTEVELKCARECPRCEKINTERTYLGVSISSYVRGYGYLDREGCHRDMNLYKLTSTDDETGLTTDPYADMREPGEVDELKIKLKRGGKHNPKPVRFLSPKRDSGDMQAAVKAAATIKIV